MVCNFNTLNGSVDCMLLSLGSMAMVAVVVITLSLLYDAFKGK